MPLDRACAFVNPCTHRLPIAFRQLLFSVEKAGYDRCVWAGWGLQETDNQGRAAHRLIESDFNQILRLTAPSGTTTFQYDLNGNQTTKTQPSGTTTYTWDARDRLVQASSAVGMNHFGYDTRNLRVFTQDGQGSQRVLLDGIEELAEYEVASGTREERFDHEFGIPDALLAQVTSQEKTFFVEDALRSVYGLVDTSGATRASFNYDVFGARSVQIEEVTTKWVFTGRRAAFDGASELYSRQRYLSPLAGAFLQADPVGLLIALDDGPNGEPRELVNRYAYVGQMPTRLTDPSGLFGFGQIYSAGTNEIYELIVSYFLQAFTIERYEKIALGYTNQECSPTAGACLDSAATNVRVAAAGPKSLLGYRVPVYLFYHSFGMADQGHYDAIIDLQSGILGRGVIMTGSCISAGYRALAFYFIFLGALPIPLPQLRNRF